MTARLGLLVLIACGGCNEPRVDRNQGARPAPEVVVETSSDPSLPVTAPPAGQLHQIPTSALHPWTSRSEPLVTDEGSAMGDRITARHDVFNVGGFRLTFVPIKARSGPETIGRIEYVFRARSLHDVSERLVEALRRFGFAVPPPLAEVIARAAQIPDDLAGLDQGTRLVSEAFDWAPGWRGFVKLYAEGAIEGDDTHRAQWMVELRAFQPAFRAVSDP